jgi:bifunctional non-homologous end joining protein LigD
MKNQPAAGDDLAPMLATEGSVDKLKSTQWAFEGKWDGYRVLVDANRGKLNLRSRRGRDVTDEYPQFEALAADLADHHVILDGEAVALDESGVPSFSEMQNRARSTRVEYWAFDILHLDGRSLLRAKYSDRRRLLEALASSGGLIVPDQLPGDGPEAMEHARKHRWEGVVAKKGFHLPAGAAVVVVDQRQDLDTQEVVIGGWRRGEVGAAAA